MSYTHFAADGRRTLCGQFGRTTRDRGEVDCPKCLATIRAPPVRGGVSNSSRAAKRTERQLQRMLSAVPQGTEFAGPIRWTLETGTGTGNTIKRYHGEVTHAVLYAGNELTLNVSYSGHDYPPLQLEASTDFPTTYEYRSNRGRVTRCSVDEGSRGPRSGAITLNGDWEEGRRTYTWTAKLSVIENRTKSRK
jgi:hypothetical protein